MYTHSVPYRWLDVYRREKHHLIVLPFSSVAIFGRSQNDGRDPKAWVESDFQWIWNMMKHGSSSSTQEVWNNLKHSQATSKKSGVSQRSMFQAGYIHIVENKRHIFGPFNETYSYCPFPALFWGLHTCVGNNRTTPISTSAHTDITHLQLSTYMHCYFFPFAFTYDIHIYIYIHNIYMHTHTHTHIL